MKCGAHEGRSPAASVGRRLCRGSWLVLTITIGACDRGTERAAQQAMLTHQQAMPTAGHGVACNVACGVTVVWPVMCLWCGLWCACGVTVVYPVWCDCGV